jgi:hypothetical protein
VECQVCQVRSAIGRCEESNKLVCEECSTGCYRCGKRIAVTAGHQTRSGHLYCTPCYKERADRKAARVRQDEPNENMGLIQDQVAPRPGRAVPGEPPDQEVDEVILSQWEPPAPWKMSLYLALAAILLSFFFMFFPDYRTIPLSGGGTKSYIPLGLLGILLSVIGAVWAVIGLTNVRFIEQRTQTIIGLVLTLIAGVMAISVTKPPPLSDAESALTGSATPRQFGSEAEREQWRQNFLGGQRQQPPAP